jgi:hypothetical protein
MVDIAYSAELNASDKGVESRLLEEAMRWYHKLQSTFRLTDPKKMGQKMRMVRQRGEQLLEMFDELGIFGRLKDFRVANALNALRK